MNIKNLPFKKIALFLLVALVIAQFIKIDKNNPPVEKELDFLSISNPPADIKAMVQNACYDCHSHETAYPWYTDVAPVSFWVKGHINGGREHLNFSEWGSLSGERKARKLDECIEFTEKKWMPLKSYTWGHPEAKLTQEDRQKLVDWFASLK